MDWKPIGDKVIARKIRKHHGVIRMLDERGEYTGTAEVLAVGEAPKVGVGDIIILSPMAGVSCDGALDTDVVVVFQQEILAVKPRGAVLLEEYEQIEKMQKENLERSEGKVLTCEDDLDNDVTEEEAEDE